VGYTGGTATAPTYESVCSGDGHTEAIRIEYNRKQISYEQLLGEFFKHSSGDSGGKPQYKSAIWYHTEEQKAVAETSSTAQGKRLEVMPAPEWYDAEEYHQKYIEKGGGCTVQ